MTRRHVKPNDLLVASSFPKNRYSQIWLRSTSLDAASTLLQLSSAKVAGSQTPPIFLVWIMGTFVLYRGRMWIGRIVSTLSEQEVSMHPRFPVERCTGDSFYKKLANQSPSTTIKVLYH